MINIVLERKFEKIVYISCDYQTLARNIKLLSSHYDVEKVQPVDMFPNTYHVETIVLLKRKNIYEI
ncbi:MAG: hypothetical protein E7184_03675 [Erysipelotrichaceae bacterium]|nr:hypothetical protein [Erysipelotrichaceae bacterium]